MVKAPFLYGASMVLFVTSRKKRNKKGASPEDDMIITPDPRPGMPARLLYRHALPLP